MILLFQEILASWTLLNSSMQRLVKHWTFSKVSQLLPFPRLWTGPFPKTLGCTGFIFSKVMGRLFQGLCCFLFKGNAVLDYLLIGQQVQVVQHSFSKGAPCAWPLGAECHRHPAPIPWLLWWSLADHQRSLCSQVACPVHFAIFPNLGENGPGGSQVPILRQALHVLQHLLFSGTPPHIADQVDFCHRQEACQSCQVSAETSSSFSKVLCQSTQMWMTSFVFAFSKAFCAFSKVWFSWRIRGMLCMGPAGLVVLLLLPISSIMRPGLFQGLLQLCLELPFLFQGVSRHASQVCPFPRTLPWSWPLPSPHLPFPRKPFPFPRLFCVFHGLLMCLPSLFQGFLLLSMLGLVQALGFGLFQGLLHLLLNPPWGLCHALPFPRRLFQALQPQG